MPKFTFQQINWACETLKFWWEGIVPQQMVNSLKPGLCNLNKKHKWNYANRQKYTPRYVQIYIFTSNTHVYIIYTKSCQTINDVTGAFNREIFKLAIYKIDPKWILSSLPLQWSLLSCQASTICYRVIFIGPGKNLQKIHLCPSINSGWSP